MSYLVQYFNDAGNYSVQVRLAMTSVLGAGSELGPVHLMSSMHNRACGSTPLAVVALEPPSLTGAVVTEREGTCTLSAPHSFICADAQSPFPLLNHVCSPPPPHTPVQGADHMHGCYGGTSALFTVTDWVASPSWDGRLGLVVATDIAVYPPGSPARPTGRADGTLTEGFRGLQYWGLRMRWIGGMTSCGACQAPLLGTCTVLRTTTH
jgi:hypothetical protein